jgi:uncharacterized membrane protein YdcZ (DUF606 family)
VELGVRRFVAGGFVGATWATWTAIGPPTLGTAVLIVVVVTGLLWSDLTRTWRELA